MAGTGLDVVIVGGGPAGGAVAILLVRFGLSCLVIERRASGAPKLCGEFLSPESLPILRALSVEKEIRRLGSPVIESVRVTGTPGGCWEGRLPRSGLGITRQSLENAILEQASSLGAHVMRGAFVRRIAMRGNEAWSVEVDRYDGARTAISARSVVCATGRDGARSDHRRAGERYIAYQAHFDGPSLQGRVELHGFQGGYAGLIDVERHRRNLCLLAKPSIADSRRRSGEREIPPNRPEAVLGRIARSNRHFASWLEQAKRISEWTSASVSGSCNGNPVSEEGALTLGDAAGAIAPLAGDGRAMALRSAEILAPILHEHLSGRISLQHAGAIWRREWRREFRRRTWVALALNGILIHPFALTPFLAIIRAVPAIGTAAIALTRGHTRNGSGEPK